MAAVALNAAKSYYEEKHDKGSFIKNIISDNILISDIYMRAKELHVAAEVTRGVFVIRPVDDRMDAAPWMWCRACSPTGRTTLSCPWASTTWCSSSRWARWS